jgi:hypothetical protein
MDSVGAQLLKHFSCIQNRLGDELAEVCKCEQFHSRKLFVLAKWESSPPTQCLPLKQTADLIVRGS